MDHHQRDAFYINEREIMEFFGYKGAVGKFKLRCRFFRSWFLHVLAYSSPYSDFVIRMQRARGIKIGKNCHISPYVLFDLLYPELITIENNVTVGSNALIFTHVNPTANLFLKKTYPRKVEPVKIKSGAVLFPGCIITAGVTIGENSMVGAGSVVFEDVPDYCIAIGNPARVVKKIDH